MIFIENALKKIIENIYTLKVETITLANPPKPELGDYAFGCFLLARDTKKAPPQIATEIKAYFDEHKDDYAEIESMEVAAGYLNIKVANITFTKVFLEAIASRQIFANFEKKDETIIVDYIGANVGKPLHIGHMCTPNIGQSLVNLYRKLGYNVIGDSHIGDWGIIFGKLILAYKLWGSEEKLKENAIDHLLELYIKVTEEIEKEEINSPPLQGGVGGGNQTTIPPLTPPYKGGEISHEQATRDTFKLLSEGNSESIKMWESFTRESIRFMNLQLARLNVKPDYNIGESFYEGLGLPKMENYPDLKFPMEEVVKELISKEIAIKNDDNSVGVEFEKMPSTILQKRDGTHGYLASDLATIRYRTDNSNNKITDENGIHWSNIKKIIYSVDIRQELHLSQVFDIARRAGWVEGIELFHAANGFISLKDGAMSTRTGKIIRLEALLDEAETRAKKIILEKRQDIQGEELKKLARIIGIGAIKYGYLSKSRLTNVVFDWDEFMTFEGNSGPYIQYAYVRAKSVLGDQKNVIPDVISVSFEFTEEKELLKSLLEYKNILLQASRENYPHIIAGYAYELTKKFNSLYAKVPLQNENDADKRNLRLLLVDTFAKILKDTFSILAIDMPERM